MNGGAVPLVGQTLVAHRGYVMCTATCLCQTNNPPMFIRGTDVIEICAKCGNQYAIVGAMFDREHGDTQPAVSVALVGTANAEMQPEASDAAPVKNEPTDE